ncbi:MAG: ABC transporter ATP-binding protein [Burkholderiaceae bacterium]|nr:ABC transporter ATP-binding protein [Burkholderiaceae bacterium]
MDQQPVLDVKNLKTTFSTERGKITAVDGISFALKRGEILGVVGESGCGKSATAQSILRLYDEHYTSYAGEVWYEGRDLLSLHPTDMHSVRGNHISMIFQDPLSSLNPVYTIGNQIAEAILIHKNVTRREANARVIELLRMVGIPAPTQRVKEYPHELSGGMRQRVMIAMALACEPKVLIADEPTTALDVTIQAQIMNLIKELNKKFDMGIILITHDLGVVAEVCTRVLVMYLGQIVEEADVHSLFTHPRHPYTRGLMKSIPQLDCDRSEPLHVIEGMVPSLHKIPQGCRFAPRCPYADDLCHAKMPALEVHGNGQKVRCWHAEKITQDAKVTHA